MLNWILILLGICPRYPPTTPYPYETMTKQLSWSLSRTLCHPWVTIRSLSYHLLSPLKRIKKNELISFHFFFRMACSVGNRFSLLLKCPLKDHSHSFRRLKKTQAKHNGGKVKRLTHGQLRLSHVEHNVHHDTHNKNKTLTFVFYRMSTNNRSHTSTNMKTR